MTDRYYDTEGNLVVLHLQAKAAQVFSIPTTKIINALKKNYITKKKANDLINMVDVFEYSLDLLGPEKIIMKMNREIIEEELHIPHFNSLCVLCGEIYDSY